jgi:UDP-N-acetylmuramoylalanine--D-glutamate ligase
LRCYEDIFWIVGGRAKTDGIDALTPHFPRLRKAYLIGEAAPLFAPLLAAHGVPYTLSHTLEHATSEAHLDAQRFGKPQAVVLLSPACASFDQFRSFEHRGDCFRAMVNALTLP